MPNILYDVIILAVLAGFLLAGIRRGFVLSLCGALAVVVALVGASLGARELSPHVAQALEPRLAAVIETQLDQQIADAIQEGRTDFEEGALTGVLALLRGTGFYQELADAVEEAVENGMTGVAARIAASAGASLAETVSLPLIFLVLFVAILLLWKAASHLLDLAFRLPVLHTLNQLGGGVFGVVKGALVLFVLVWLLRYFSLLPAQETIDATVLLRFFAETNPLTLLLYGVS